MRLGFDGGGKGSGVAWMPDLGRGLVLGGIGQDRMGGREEERGGNVKLLRMGGVLDLGGFEEENLGETRVVVWRCGENGRGGEVGRKEQGRECVVGEGRRRK